MSLFKRQLVLLGYEQGPMDDATRAEKERQAGLPLAPLNLPTELAQVRVRKSFRAFWPVLAAALFAGVLVSKQLLWRIAQPGDTIRAKGDNKVWVYWERQGQVQQLEPGVNLENGDRVRAEVLASEDLVGYLAVKNGRNQLLSDPQQVKDSALHLKAGEKATFSGSVKLVGANEGERLVVVLCGAGADFDVTGFDTESLPEGCGVQEFSLRTVSP